MEAEWLTVFDNEYFAINKKLQTITGLWPYIPIFQKTLKRIVISVILFLLTAPHAIAIKMWCGKDLALCGENVAGIIYAFGVVAKFSATIAGEKQITNTYKLLAKNWLSINDPEEKKILMKYAAIGKLLGVIYLAYMCLAGIVFSQFSMISPVLDLLFPLNESRPKTLVAKGEYLFDPYKHFYELYLAYCIMAFTSVFVFVSVDVPYVAVVHQSLATFSIVEHRLHKAATIYLENKNLGYNTIISAIRMHKDALQFIDVIDNSYGPCLLYLVSVTTVFMAVGAITVLEHMGDILDLMRYFMFIIGVVIHMFYISWPGQKVIDHSSDLFLQMYTCRWYQVNERGKTLLRIMMLKSLKPNLLTACGFYNMSFENYATIMKTAMSYITVAISFRE